MRSLILLALVGVALSTQGGDEVFMLHDSEIDAEPAVASHTDLPHASPKVKARFREWAGLGESADPDKEGQSEKAQEKEESAAAEKKEEEPAEAKADAEEPKEAKADAAPTKKEKKEEEPAEAKADAEEPEEAKADAASKKEKKEKEPAEAKAD